jgi:hypothetical protein
MQWISAVSVMTITAISAMTTSVMSRRDAVDFSRICEDHFSDVSLRCSEFQPATPPARHHSPAYSLTRPPPASAPCQAREGWKETAVGDWIS